MSSFQLFRQRLFRNWKYQLKTFLSVADWTIWVYLIIPSFVISIFVYRSWWIEAPDWIQWVPIGLFFLIGYLFSWSGSFRTFIEEADNVFLAKKGQNFHRLKKWGAGYSLLFQGFLTSIIVAVMLPFFIQHFQLSWAHACAYFLYLLGLKFLLMYVKFRLRGIEKKPLRVMATVVVFVLFAWGSRALSVLWVNGEIMLVALFGLMLGAIGVMSYYPLLKKKSIFATELSIEREEKLKLVNLIYLTSFDIEKPKIYTRKKPWLFRNSWLIFKKRNARNGFIELFIKIFLRNSSYFLTYIQICSVTIVALLVVPPIWIKGIIFAGFLIMMWVWIEGTWERIVLSHPFSKKYVEQISYFSARKIVMRSLYIFSILFIIVIVGVGLWMYNHLSIAF